MTRLTIENMTCGHCKAAVEKAVASVDPTARVTVDLPGKIVDVESGVSDAAIMSAIRSEGYEPSLAS